MNPLDIYVPGVFLEVVVIITPEHGLTPLEQLAVRAIAAGGDTISGLNSLFGIGQRPTLDLIFDLWRRAHIMVDFATGKVALTGRTKVALEQSRLDELDGSTIEQAWEVFVDAMTQSFWLDAHKSSPRGAQTVPVPHAIIDPLQLSDRQLNRIIASKAQLVLAGSEQRVVAAYISTRTHKPPRRGWLRVEIVAHIDDASGQLRVLIVDPPDIPPHTRRPLQESLAKFVRDNSRTNFAQRIHNHADQQPGTPRTFIEIRADMQRVIGGMQLANPSDRERRQGDLSVLLAEFASRGRPRELVPITLSWLTRNSTIVDLCTDLISGAEQQIVLAAPKLHYANFSAWIPRLRDAIERGVQLFVIWGAQDDQALEQRTRNALEGLRDAAPARVFYSRDSAAIHNWVMLFDAAHAVIASRRFAWTHDGSTSALGIHLRSRSPNQTPGPISDLLQWARDCVDDHRVGISMLRPDDCDDGRERSLDSSISAPVAPKLLQDNRELERAAASLWQRGWQQTLTEIDFWAAANAGVSVVTDVEQINQVWDGLHQARRRVLLISRGVRSGMLGPKLLTRLSALVDHGLEIRILCRRVDTSERDKLQQLTRKFGKRFQWRVVDSNSPQLALAPLFCHDDSVLLGTYDLLDSDPARLVMQRHARASELGLVIDSPEFVDAMWASTEPHESLRGGTVDFGDELPTAPPINVATRLTAVLAQVSEADEPNRPRLLFDGMMASGDPEFALRLLSEAGCPDAYLIAAATLLSTTQTGDGGREFLARRLWSCQRFIEAMILVHSLERPPRDFVSPALAQIAGCWTITGEQPLLFVHAVVKHANVATHELELLALLGSVEVLTRGLNELVAVLDEIADRLPPSSPNRSLWTLVHVRSARTAGPLALARFDNGTAAQHTDQELGQRWRELSEALEYFTDYSKRADFKIGIEVTKFLADAGGVLGQLRAIIERGDSAAISKWLNDHRLTTPDDAGDFLAQATAEWKAGAEIVGARRSLMVRMIAKIIRAAHQVVKLRGILTNQSGVAVPTHDAEFARALAELWPQFDNWESALPSHYAILYRAALAPLRPVRKWGAES